MRCFLALPLEQPALRCAAEVLASLSQRVDGVRWVRPESLHVTVHFFGSIDDEQAVRAVSAVTEVCAHSAPLQVRLAGLGSFPERRRPRVVWLGAAEAHADVELFVTRIHAALGAAGFPLEPRPFRLHCTLGRIRDAWSEAQQRAWEAARLAITPDCAQTSSRLVLYETKQSPSGSAYVERAVLPLAG